MTRICIVGDSHIAALKAGWRSIESEFADARLEFFGAPGKHMAGLAVSEGRLVGSTRVLRGHLEKTSGGEPEIGACYDRYLVCGLGLSIFHATHVYNRFRAENQKQDSRTPVSDDCFLESLSGCLAATLAVETLDKLRTIVKSPVGVIANPLPGAKSRETSWKRLARTGDDRSLAHFFTASCERIVAERDARFLPQPTQTLAANPMTTQSVFAEVPERLVVQDAEGDQAHMNAQYGAIVLREALRAMLVGD